MKKITGRALKTPEAATTETTSFTLSDSEGKAVGFTLSEPYTSAELSQMLLTVEQQSKVHLKDVPLNVLRSQNGNVYIPFDGGLDVSLSINVKLQSLVGTSQALKPIYLVLYHE